MNEIDKQIEQAPLSYEESKAQFERVTKEQGIQHTFKFDDVWELMQDLQRKKQFRSKIESIEANGHNDGLWMSDEEMKSANPVKNSFADGCYIREITNPADELLVTKIHKKEHPFFLMEGDMSILTEKGIKRIKAPHHGITKVGTKRIIYTHTKCVFVTVHATELTDVDEIEKEVIAEGFYDPVVTLSDIELLKESI